MKLDTSEHESFACWVKYITEGKNINLEEVPGSWSSLMLLKSVRGTIQAIPAGVCVNYYRFLNGTLVMYQQTFGSHFAAMVLRPFHLSLCFPFLVKHG